MNHSSKNKLSLLILFGSILIYTSDVKCQNVTVEQDSKFEQLLNEKRKINASIHTTDRWKIQIYTGDNESTKKSLQEFKREFKDVDATIIFHTPTYKVWVGNFKTRIEAERNLKELKKKYPHSFLISPKT